MRALAQLLRNRSGAAAAEMALVIPFLVVLMFGAVDLGNYFLSEHVVDKAVRDASRYAARLPLADYTSCTVPSAGTAEQQTQRVARFGDPSGSGNQRLAGWTADNMTTLTITCDDGVSSGNAYATGGIYTDFPDGAPVVRVTATVPYHALFGMIGFGSMSFTLQAESEAAVIGA
jgi:Flp pilus assembly protein TadG